MRAGIAQLPHGKCKLVLHEDLEQRLLPLFAERVLAFDLSWSRAYAEIISRARALGRAIVGADASIAAIAATHGFAVATCDAAPFQAAGLKVINPWLD